MADPTVIAPAPAGDMSDDEANTAFEALAAARFDPTDDPTPAATPDEPAEPTPAAPAAVVAPTPAPTVPAPAAAVTDIWQGATPELRAAHEAALARERQRYNSDLGRQAAYQNRIKSLEDEIAARVATPAATAPATAAAAPVSLRETAAIKKSLEDYPEVVGPILDALEPIVADNTRMSRDLSNLQEGRRADVIATQEQALTAAHPDWRVACGSKDFADWLGQQPQAIKQIVQRNGEQVVDAAEAIAMVGNFKAHFALTHPRTPQAVTPAIPVPVPAPTNLSARREAQLAAVTTAPKGAPVAIPDGPVGGEEAAVFAHFVAKKAKKG